jgi:ATP-dependent Clp protease ATP-binding subunit ClpB
VNTQKLTQKSIEVLQSAQSLASEYGNPQIEQEHVLYSLLTQQNGLIPQLFERLAVNRAAFESELLRLIETCRSFPAARAARIYPASLIWR